MRLAPRGSPGRSTRKARAFAAEIVQLRAQGYSFEAIREALVEAGVQVSKSTVLREMSRHVALQPRVDAVGPGRTGGHASAPAVAPASIGAPPAHQSTTGRTDLRSGKDIAQAFVRDRITNPLLRIKEPR